MENITQPGYYEVTIANPTFKAMAEKDGDDARFEVALPGVTDDGKSITAYKFFTRQLIQSGKWAGRPRYEVSAKELVELGMSDPFHPSKLSELDGVRVQFVVSFDDYGLKDGETAAGRGKLRVDWVNPITRPTLATEDATAIWDKLRGSGSDTPPASAAKAQAKPDDQDDLPF